MSYTSVFGEDLSEYEIEILTESGLAAAEWERIGQLSQQHAQYHDSRSTRHFVTKMLKASGVAVGGISALSKLTYNWATTPIKEKGKRLRPGISPAKPEAKRQQVDDAKAFEAESVANLPPSEQDASMSEATPTGSGNNLGLKETPIDRAKQVTRGPPEFTHASLPYYQQREIGRTAITYDHGFRLTSPLDPWMTAAAAVDQNAGIGTATTQTVVALDSADVTQTSARWYDFYSTLYNYYHTLGATWHMTIENLANEPIYVHVLHCNDEIPPVAASNEDIMCWNDSESHYVGTHGVSLLSTGLLETNHEILQQNNIEGGGATGTANVNFEDGNNLNSRGAGPILKLSGKYRPGQTRRQIHLDSEVENWTAVDANPQLPERLLFRFKPYWNGLDTNDANTYDRTLNVRINFRIDYLVEFKELKYGLRWPVERQPVIAAIQANIEEDEE